MTAHPPCHLLPSLEARLPLCGEGAVLATYCTMNPLLVTCPKCQQASIHPQYPLEGLRIAQDQRSVLDLSGAAMSEDRFLATVRSAAQASSWLPYHTYRSDRSESGFPDLVLAKPGHPLILSELKGAKGKMSMAQLRWYNVLQEVPGVSAYLWRPKDLPMILDLLRKPC